MHDFLSWTPFWAQDICSSHCVIYPLSKVLFCYSALNTSFVYVSFTLLTRLLSPHVIFCDPRDAGHSLVFVLLSVVVRCCDLLNESPSVVWKTSRFTLTELSLVRSLSLMWPAYYDQDLPLHVATYWQCHCQQNIITLQLSIILGLFCCISWEWH